MFWIIVGAILLAALIIILVINLINFFTDPERKENIEYRKAVKEMRNKDNKTSIKSKKVGFIGRNKILFIGRNKILFILLPIPIILILTIIILFLIH